MHAFDIVEEGSQVVVSRSGNESLTCQQVNLAVSELTSR